MVKVKQTIYDLLRGKFLVDEDAPKNWRMLIFLASLALIMIGSSHSIDKKVQDKARLHILEEHHLEKWYGDLSSLHQHLKEHGK